MTMFGNMQDRASLPAVACLLLLVAGANATRPPEAEKERCINAERAERVDSQWPAQPVWACTVLGLHTHHWCAR